MDAPVFSAFVDELEKLSASKALLALDRAGQLSSAVPGFGSNLAKRTPIPAAGSFGVKTSAGGDDGSVVAAGDRVFSAEEKVPLISRRKQAEAIEKMDAPSWKQTAKDVPVVVLGSGLGYGVGKTVAEEVAKRYGKKNPATWAKHAPMVGAMASSLGSYALGRSREQLKERREKARERASK